MDKSDSAYKTIGEVVKLIGLKSKNENSLEVPLKEARENFEKEYLISQIKKFGGKFLVRGGKQEEKEGEGFERTVLVEFSSLDLARQCYESSDYAEALSYSNQSSNRLVVLVEGLE